ncbi:MAG: 50S ribosomal protein L29 [Kiritimatiellae bacterium]|jgi:large subunit ribosomal protein L29|nr:50S ribosomal protein L29 [Kiritimatiellia bacterium]
MKTKELRELATDELKQSYQERLKEYFDLRKVKATGKLDNPLQLRQKRRDIARIKTLLNERTRERAGSNAAK